MGTKNAGAKRAAKKETKKETKKPGTAFAWKLQAEAIGALDKRVEDSEKNIIEVARYAEQSNELRKKGYSRLHSDILFIEKVIEKQEWTKRNTLFWLTMLGLTMAALNMAMLHLLVNG